jgi:regulator of sigma E protease
MAAQLILGLSILVVLHELGHFLAARAFGIKVEKFYLFFDAWGFKLFSFRVGDTEYGVGWLPLGGYVKIAGMIDESMDKEQLKQEPQPWEFRSKPAWQRLIVMIGGVTMNVILAVIIFWMITFRYGESYVPNSEVKHGIVAYESARELGLQNGDRVIEINGKPFERFDKLMSSEVLFGNSTLTVLRNSDTVLIKIPADFIEKFSEKGKEEFIDRRFTFYVAEVSPGLPAEKAGLKAGDVITSVNTKPVRFFDELQAALREQKGKPVSLGVMRNNEPLELSVAVDKDGKIGFRPDTKDFIPQTAHYSLAESFPIGARKSWQALADNAKGLGKIFKGEVSASNSVQGPIGIARFYGGEWIWLRFWTMTGLLSMVLALMNILPIPALDGGHVVFLTIEAITRRKLSDSFMEKAQVAGMVILLSLMVFAFGNDIWKNFLK